MAELSKQEKKVLDAKFKKASKQLLKEGFDKKEVKNIEAKNFNAEEILPLNDEEFLNFLKASLTKEEAAPQEEAPVEEAPAEEDKEEAPVEEAKEETPVEEAPAEEAKEEAPVEEAPVEEAKEEAPVEEAPAEEAKEEAPVEEAPQEEAKEEAPAEASEEEKKEDFEKQVEEIIGEDIKGVKEPPVDPDEETQDEELTKEESEALEAKEKEKAKKKAPLKKSSEKKPSHVPSKAKPKMDEDEDDEEDDNEEDKEEDAALQGYNRKVLLKLKVASDRTQQYYSDLRNELRCYKALKFKSNNTGDTYSYKGKVVFKVTIFPKALKVYYALRPQDFDIKKYHHKNVKDIKRYETIPLLLRVGSDRGYKYSLELLASLAKKLKIAKTKAKAFDYMPDFNTTSKALLVENGGEELLRASCTKDHSNVISDSLAKKCMMLRVRKPIEGEKNIAEISIGELSAAFKTSYKIDLDLLKKVGLAKKDTNYLKVTAMNNCYKAITITADEFEPEVIRMVVVTGGNITKLVK